MVWLTLGQRAGGNSLVVVHRSAQPSAAALTGNLFSTAFRQTMYTLAAPFSPELPPPLLRDAQIGRGWAARKKLVGGGGAPPGRRRSVGCCCAPTRRSQQWITSRQVQPFGARPLERGRQGEEDRCRCVPRWQVRPSASRRDARDREAPPANWPSAPQSHVQYSYPYHDDKGIRTRYGYRNVVLEVTTLPGTHTGTSTRYHGLLGSPTIPIVVG